MNSLTKKEKKEYIDDIEKIKKTTYSILNIVLVIGNEYYCDLDTLNNFLQSSSINENDFYDFLYEKDIDYVINKQLNTISGLTINQYIL
jgi:hypothetical protein